MFIGKVYQMPGGHNRLGALRDAVLGVLYHATGCLETTLQVTKSEPPIEGLEHEL